MIAGQDSGSRHFSGDRGSPGSRLAITFPVFVLDFEGVGLEANVPAKLLLAAVHAPTKAIELHSFRLAHDEYEGDFPNGKASPTADDEPLFASDDAIFGIRKLYDDQPVYLSRDPGSVAVLEKISHRVGADLGLNLMDWWPVVEADPGRNEAERGSLLYILGYLSGMLPDCRWSAALDATLKRRVESGQLQDLAVSSDRSPGPGDISLEAAGSDVGFRIDTLIAAWGWPTAFMRRVLGLSMFDLDEIRLHVRGATPATVEVLEELELLGYLIWLLPQRPSLPHFWRQRVDFGEPVGRRTPIELIEAHGRDAIGMVRCLVKSKSAE